jgi:hypothetical protein
MEPGFNAAAASSESGVRDPDRISSHGSVREGGRPRKIQAQVPLGRRGPGAGGSDKKNEDFSFFSVDLIQIAGFMLNQRKNRPSSSP